MSLGIGATLSEAMAVIRGKFGSLVGIWAVYLALTIGGTVIFAMMAGLGGLTGAALAGGESLTGAGLGALGAGFFLAMILFYIAYIYLTMAQAASMTALASPLQDVSFGQALSTGFRSGLPLLGTGLLLVIAYFLIAIPLSFVARALGSAGSLLSFALLIGIIYLGCRLSLVAAIAAIENVGNPITIIRRSWEATRGSALPIFLMFLVLALILLVLIGVMAIPVLGQLSAGTTPGGGTIGFLAVCFFVVSLLAAVAQNAIIATIHGKLSGRVGENIEDTFA